MLKTMLLIGAAAMSFPALAQEAPVDTAVPPASQPSEPVSETAPPAPDTEPAPPVTEPAPAPGETATTEPAPAEGTPASASQVAQIIDREFPAYDADSSAELSEVEFAGWMKKLRAASEPTVDVESAEVQTWIGQAWSAADADKNGTVSKEELTAFLSKGA